jgi:glycerate 2-kinase
MLFIGSDLCLSVKSVAVHMNLEELRTTALEIFNHALLAVDAQTATRNAVTLDHSVLQLSGTEFEVSDRSIYVVGLGKAALSMALGLNEVVGEKISRAVISSSASSKSLPSTYKIFSGGHPLPNQDSLTAASAAFDLLGEANGKKAVVIFLVSGGGSAMMEWPISEDIKLDDLREANRQLITCGASINEVNAVRRSISAVKGGGLAQRAPEADIVTLIVSDTNRGDESSVASGPTIAPHFNSPTAHEVIEKYGLIATLPPSVVSAIRATRTKTINERVSNAPVHVLLDNRVALEAASQRAIELGFSSVVDDDINEQPVDEGSDLLLSRGGDVSTLPSCLISGGEFACRVGGKGRGGRNLETALRCAIKLDQESDKPNHHTVVVSTGTDGIDGSSNAAGAIADENTIARAQAIGLDAVDYLRSSDSHAFFETLGDLLVTGPTGTNVRDLRLVLRA